MKKINRKTSCVYELEDLTVLRWSYIPNLSKDSMKSPSKSQCPPLQNEKEKPKIHMQFQGGLIAKTLKKNKVGGLILFNIKTHKNY